MKQIILIYTILITFNAFAYDFNEAKDLHDESCVECHIIQHDDDFYNRSDKKMKNIFNLKSQVNRCSSVFQTGWFPEEKNSVVKYLNQQFYKFDK